MKRALPLLLLAGLLLSACQSGGSSAPPVSTSANNGITPEYIASLPPDQSRPVVDRLASEVVAAESETCREDPEVDWEACVSTRMLLVFDRYGFLAHHCRDRTSNEELRDCVAFGRSGVDWLLAIGGDPDTDFDWSKPEQSHAAALKKLNDVLTERCAGKPEAPGNSCFTSLSATLLGLSDVVAARCAARPELEQRGACIIDAHNSGMYGAALASLSR